MSKKSSQQKITVKYNKCNSKNLYFTDTIENQTLPGQKLAFPRYKDPKKGDGRFVLQGPWMKLDNYGIPNKDSPYHKNDKDRSKIKIPLDARQDLDNESSEDCKKRTEDLKAFKSTLEKLDNRIESELMTEVLGSGKSAKKYEYVRIVRKGLREVVKDSDSDEDSDEEDQEVQKEQVWKPDYMSSKIDLDWESGDITALLYKTNKEGTDDFEKDGKRSKIKVTTLDEFQKYVHYMSKFQPIFLANKLWIAPKKPGEKKGRVGMTLKLIQVQVELREQNNNNEDLKNDAFIDSDSESDDDVSPQTVQKLNLDDDDDNEESGSESEEEEEEEEVIVKKSKKKKKSKNKSA
jgi:hypothetical protein